MTRAFLASPTMVQRDVRFTTFLCPSRLSTLSSVARERLPKRTERDVDCFRTLLSPTTLGGATLRKTHAVLYWFVPAAPKPGMHGLPHTRPNQNEAA